MSEGLTRAETGNWIDKGLEARYRQTDRQEMGLAFRSLSPLPECGPFTDPQSESSRACKPGEVLPSVPGKCPGPEDGPRHGWGNLLREPMMGQ